METSLDEFIAALLNEAGEVIGLFINEEDAIKASEAIPDSTVEKDFYTDSRSTHYVTFSAASSY